MSEGLYKYTFHDSIVPQVITDTEGALVEANEAFWEFLKWDFAPVCLDHAIVNGPSMEEVLTNVLRHNRWEVQSYINLGDNSKAWVHIHFSGIRVEDEVKYLYAQVLNINKQKQLANDLEKKQGEVDQFASIAAHDLREPVVTLIGFATLLQSRCSDQLDPNGQRWLTDVISSAKSIECKIDDLLAFSRAGKETPMAVFSLGSAVEEAKRSVVRLIKNTGAKIHLQNSPQILGDRSMIAQVFQNLFSNSIKYKRDDVTPEISINATPHGDSMWCIEVADNGLGFDMQFKDQVFRVFQRLYTIDQYPGTGMGLTITKKIIKRHGGEIWPESEPGNGTKFYFTLPATQK